MSNERFIRVRDLPKVTVVETSHSLRRLSERLEVIDLITRLGTGIKSIDRLPEYDEWSIIPPLEYGHIEVFKQALKEQAQLLCPDAVIDIQH